VWKLEGKVVMMMMIMMMMMMMRIMSLTSCCSCVLSTSNARMCCFLPSNYNNHTKTGNYNKLHA